MLVPREAVVRVLVVRVLVVRVLVVRVRAIQSHLMRVDVAGTRRVVGVMMRRLRRRFRPGHRPGRYLTEPRIAISLDFCCVFSTRTRGVGEVGELSPVGC